MSCACMCTPGYGPTSVWREARDDGAIIYYSILKDVQVGCFGAGPASKCQDGRGVRCRI